MSEQSTPDPATVPEVDQSIVDTILDLDALLSADVRRAEGVAYIYGRADLEATLDVLRQEYDDAVAREAAGGGEKSMSERSAETIKTERDAVRAQYLHSRITVPVRQMASDEWDAFRVAHKDQLDGAYEISDIPVDVADELIAKSLLTKTPATVEQVQAMRQKFGSPQIQQIALRAWQVNQHSGTSVPK